MSYLLHLTPPHLLLFRRTPLSLTHFDLFTSRFGLFSFPSILFFGQSESESDKRWILSETKFLLKPLCESLLRFAEMERLAEYCENRKRGEDRGEMEVVDPAVAREFEGESEKEEL